MSQDSALLVIGLSSIWQLAHRRCSRATLSGKVDALSDRNSGHGGSGVAVVAQFVRIMSTSRAQWRDPWSDRVVLYVISFRSG